MFSAHSWVDDCMVEWHRSSNAVAASRKGIKMGLHEEDKSPKTCHMGAVMTSEVCHFVWPVHETRFETSIIKFLQGLTMTIQCSSRH